MISDLLILVDENDRQVGVKEKLRVHQDGDLHRALSVFLFDPGGRLLLQQRAGGKYHSAGLWTNTCCSHPRPGEDVKDAAVRRLEEEMGIRCGDLQPAFTFTYQAAVGNGLVEHEFDHVFAGTSDAAPAPDPQEVGGYKYMTLHEIEEDLVQHPLNYTTWFRLIFSRIKTLREKVNTV